MKASSTYAASSLYLLSLVFILLLRPTFATKKSYVVYLGAHSHGNKVTSSDYDRATESHYHFLGSFLGSADKAKDAIFYSYNKHINGFAAFLEDKEASEISRHPRVVSVFLNQGRKIHTTRSWDFLGLEDNGVIEASSLWKKARFGEDAIIGNLDTEIGNGDEQVKADAIRIGHYMDGEFPRDNKEFAKRIFYTVFMASENSLDGSRNQSRVIAEEIGSWHLDVSINGVVSSLLSLFQTLTGKWPRTKENGGTNVENTALLNIQSRSRMVVAYMLASLLPWVHAKPGFYLLLSTTTADEALSGNLTKYGCSSGDINPIGSINKQDLRSFLKWASTNLGYSSLAQVEEHKDDVELGMSEEELSLYARLRRTFQCGPLSMFENLCAKWGPKLCPREIGEKVKHFFKSYSTNRHKMTVLTPSYLVESNSADDNRFDLRQFMYNVWWPYQFRKIDERIVELNGDAEGLLRSSDQEIVRI